ncbi:hypothetical protein QTP70_026736 [Hemibagrus guttatus]|uniref:Tc1-like transposase DDE domain-containing protein n=1 Tax=Hemibagrus guttatus TaxID=175788 RepID=A0AAE0ULG0_9TELE|nr:hypothetical protein QTP70_026736 [Hemibagrus guttatus]
MGKRKRVDKGQTVMARRLDLQNCSSCVVFPVCSARTTYLSIVTDHLHPFMETVFPDGCGLFQQNNTPCHKAKMGQEWFDEHNEFEVLTWPPNSPDLNPTEHLWDVLDKQLPSMEAPPHNLEDLKDLLLTYHSTPSGI